MAAAVTRLSTGPYFLLPTLRVYNKVFPWIAVLPELGLCILGEGEVNATGKVLVGGQPFRVTGVPDLDTGGGWERLNFNPTVPTSETRPMVVAIDNWLRTKYRWWKSPLARPALEVNSVPRSCDNVSSTSDKWALCEVWWSWAARFNLAGTSDVRATLARLLSVDRVVAWSRLQKETRPPKKTEAKAEAKAGDSKTETKEEAAVVARPTWIGPAGEEKAEVKEEENVLDPGFIKKQINNPRFIDQLFKSEHVLLQWKKTQYAEKKTAAAKDLARLEELMTALRKKKLPDAAFENEAKLYFSEVRRATAYENWITRIQQRLADLDVLIAEARKKEDNKFTTMPGYLDKQKGLLAMVDKVESLAGVERQSLRSAIYRRLLAFSKSAAPFIGTFINNFVLMGGPGVGKTTAAQIIGFSLYRIGLFLTDNFKETTEVDLIGQYLGQTAPRTRTALDGALEGVFFLDEAYSITPCKDKNKPGPTSMFGAEAINTLVAWSSEFKGLVSIIVAGYQYEMLNCFLTANAGLPRRFADKFMLPNYSPESLFVLLNKMVADRLKESLPAGSEKHDLVFLFGENGAQYIRETIAWRNQNKKVFENQGGDMANLTDRILIEYLTRVDPRSPRLTGRAAQNVIDTAFRAFLDEKGISDVPSV